MGRVARWVLPAAVVATGLGLLMMYLPPAGKGAGAILPLETPIALLVVGTIGVVVGVIGAWSSRSRQARVVAAVAGTQLPVATVSGGGRAANATALAGLVVALGALLAVSTVFVLEPIVVALQGPDPCGPSTFIADQPDMACFAAHPDYYQNDPDTGSWSTPGSRLSRIVDPVAWPAGLLLALCAALIGWLALGMGTSRRRTALLAMTLGSIIVVFQLVLVLGFLLGGGE